MKSENRLRWLLIAALASLTVVGAWRIRHRLLDSTQQRLVRSYQQRLISLPEREAASLIQRLAQSDDQFLEILVSATADDRPARQHDSPARAARPRRSMVEPAAAEFIAPRRQAGPTIGSARRIAAARAPRPGPFARPAADSMARRWPPRRYGQIHRRLPVGAAACPKPNRQKSASPQFQSLAPPNQSLDFTGAGAAAAPDRTRAARKRANIWRTAALHGFAVPCEFPIDKLYRS